MAPKIVAKPPAKPSQSKKTAPPAPAGKLAASPELKKDKAIDNSSVEKSKEVATTDAEMEENDAKNAGESSSNNNNSHNNNKRSSTTSSTSSSAVIPPQPPKGNRTDSSSSGSGRPQNNNAAKQNGKAVPTQQQRGRSKSPVPVPPAKKGPSPRGSVNGTSSSARTSVDGGSKDDAPRRKSCASESPQPRRRSSSSQLPPSTTESAVRAAAEAVNDDTLEVAAEEADDLQEEDGADDAGILVQKVRYDVDDVVVFEILDEHQVWQWAVGRINMRLSPRIVEIFSWERKEKTMSEEERAAAEEAMNLMREKTAAAEERMQEAEELSAKLQDEAKAIASTFEATEQRLAETKPLIEAAKESVGNIQMKDLQELRSYPKPPTTVMSVLECVMLLIGQVKDKSAVATAGNAALAKAKAEKAKDMKNQQQNNDGSYTWKDIKKFIMQETFISTVQQYDAKATTEEARKKISAQMDDPSFTQESANRASKAAGPLYQWVAAQLAYANIVKEIGPQLKQLDELKKAAKSNEATLVKTRATARKLEREIRRLKADYEKAIFGSTGYTNGTLPGTSSSSGDGASVGGVALHDWIPSKSPPKPVLHSSVLFAVKKEALSQL